MMGRLIHDQEQFFYSFRLDEAVPDDHPVREIAAVLDLSWVHSELAPYYPQLGRPSIDPVLMIRMLIVGYVFAIRSERALCRDVRVNLTYRWFCGLSIEDKIPDHSAFSTQPPGEALSPKHEAFVQAYVSRGMNGTKAYRAVYPSIKSDDVAGAAAARLLGNVRVQARIAEIMRAGAERAEVTGIDPISLSAKPFCQGEPGAMGLSRMPMARNRVPAGYVAPGILSAQRNS